MTRPSGVMPLPPLIRPATIDAWLTPHISTAQRQQLREQIDLQAALPKVVVDSRALKPGDWFLSMPTEQERRLDFAEAALGAGAEYVIIEDLQAVATMRTGLHSDKVIWLSGLDAQLGDLISHYFGHPSHDMHVIGITGTNGKSSTAFFCAQLLSALGRASAVMGTLGYGPIHQLTTGLHTTPDAFRLHQELAHFRNDQLTAVAMEVSSHSLVQQRIAGVQIDTAVMTNLTRDHLDYHGTMEAYGAAKAKLFAWPSLKRAVFNQDDDFSRQLADQFEASDTNINAQSVRYCLHSRALQSKEPLIKEPRSKALLTDDDSSAAFQVVHWQAEPFGLSGLMLTPWGETLFQIPLIGAFNLSNMLAAVAAVAPYVSSLDELQAALSALKPVPGRMEWLKPCVHQTSAPNVVIDYAHTPDALEQALLALKPHVRGKLYLVFGCGGDRDQGKRPEMGRIAAEMADEVWITSDNPRTEVPEKILHDIMAGTLAAKNCYQEEDRGKAIAKAICQASACDWVLIAGKGHETYQEIQGHRRPFSDRQQALDLIGQTF
jgi:UDP-N-acetylmuramoyl-L-alanyl-D-glutamate--2,6-diaminopimelate ligase